MLLAVENARVMGSYEKSCLIVESGKIVELGSSEICEKYRGKAKFLDAGGRILIPGIIDSHIHLLSYALSLGTLDLRGVKSLEEMKEAVKYKARARKPGEWILGHGWDQEKLKDRRYPRAEDLDEVSKENPVLLTRVCEHAGVLNSRAMRELGVNKDLLFENELYKVLRRIPLPVDANELMIKAMRKLTGFGITAVHSMDASLDELNMLRNLDRDGMLPIRVSLYLSEGLSSDHSSEMLSVEGVKVYADGSFGARTAALREEYEDQPGNSGVLIKNWREISALAQVLAERKQVLAVHAIGDRAMDEVLKAMEKGNKNIRIEHASLTPPDVIEKLCELKPLKIAIQPHFAVTDWWLLSRLGSRVKHVYRFREMLERGLSIAGSSDSPVEPANPWMSLEAAVTGGELSIDPMSLDQALRIYTPQLSPGARADFALLDQDPWGLNRFDLSGIRSDLTVVGGCAVHDPEGLARRSGWPLHGIIDSS